ncbi:MAG: hypothetical protein WC956_07350 [bacterium]
MNETRLHVEARPANWLPIPGEDEKPARHMAAVDEQDLFSKAEVEAFYPKQGYGRIRNDKGEQISFAVSEVTLIGDPNYLEQGVRIGYDASHTSHGMRITRIKIY